jgi:hypothetical protein
MTVPLHEFRWITPDGLKPYSMSPHAYKTFESSKGILRGFCTECGGTLTWYDTKEPSIEVLVGTIDDIRGANLNISKAVFRTTDVSLTIELV